MPLQSDCIKGNNLQNNLMDRQNENAQVAKHFLKHRKEESETNTFGGKAYFSRQTGVFRQGVSFGDFKNRTCSIRRYLSKGASMCLQKAHLLAMARNNKQASS